MEFNLFLKDKFILYLRMTLNFVFNCCEADYNEDSFLWKGVKKKNHKVCMIKIMDDSGFKYQFLCKLMLCIKSYKFNFYFSLRMKNVYSQCFLLS